MSSGDALIFSLEFTGGYSLILQRRIISIMLTKILTPLFFAVAGMSPVINLKELIDADLGILLRRRE